LKLIRENIEFERGLEPKNALKIGLKQEIIDLRDKLNKKLDILNNEYYPQEDEHSKAWNRGVMDTLEDVIKLIDELTFMGK